MSADKIRDLMMQALDGEISPSDKAELDKALTTDAGLRSEWEQLRTVKDKTAGLVLRPPPDEIWEGYMDSVYRRVERGIGWILLSIGAVILISTSLWQIVQQLFGDATVPLVVKGGVLALLVGGVILIVSVVREKYFVFKDDPYRDVHR